VLETKSPERIELAPTTPRSHTRTDAGRSRATLRPSAHRATGGGDSAVDGPEELAKTLLGVLGFPVERTDMPKKSRPWMTYGAVALLAIVYWFSGDGLARMSHAWGFIPAQWYRLGGITFITSFFVHAGFLHLFGNCYFLLVFGDNVEDHLGKKRFFWLLVFAHIAGMIAHGAFDERLVIGASAGVSGVIAFYALAFPRAQLGFWFLKWFRLKAATAFVLWIILQGLMSWAQLAGVGSVSALGHIGGACVGLVAGMFLRKDRREALRAPERARGVGRPERWAPEPTHVRVPETGYLRTAAQARAAWHERR
jgi:membrane associated rhomboid family serine protease